MSWRRQKNVVTDVTRSVVEAAAEEDARRRKEADHWARYHSMQRRSLPKWRWAARLFHRMQERRFRSHAKAKRGRR